MFQQAFGWPSEHEPLDNHMLTPNPRFDFEAAVHFAFESRPHRSKVVEDLNPAIETASVEQRRDYFQQRLH